MKRGIWTGITDWRKWSHSGWEALIREHRDANNSLPSACHDLWNYLSKDVRSPFYRMVAQDIEKYVEPHLEHLSERAPLKITGSKAFLEGYHLEAAGHNATHLYFTCPGAIIVTTDYTYNGGPWNTGDAVRINSSLYKRCMHISSLRNAQLVGLIDFALANNSYLFEFRSEATTHKATANLVLARKSLAFRIPSLKFAELFHNREPINYIKSFQTGEISAEPVELRQILLRNLAKELSRRFFEFRFIHRIRYYSHNDNIISGSILAAQFLYEYYRSNAHQFSKYPCGTVEVSGALERIGFYFGFDRKKYARDVMDAITGNNHVENVRKILTYCGQGDYEITNKDAIALRELLKESGYFDWKTKKN